MNDKEVSEIQALKKELKSRDKLVDELTREKTSLLKIISHDIRSPFNQMFALLQLLELDFGEITPEQKKYIDKMYRSVFGGMEMVKNLRDSRAIDEGTLTLSLEKVRIFSLLCEAIKSMNKQARLKAIEIVVDHDGSDPEIEGDRTLILKIIENILSNCIKYSGEGSRVDVIFRKEGKSVCIDFIDQGPGIPEKEIKIAFEKFRKLSPLPTLGESTTGLGLYLSKHFIELMKGVIILKNADDKGLVVSIKFPIPRNQEE